MPIYNYFCNHCNREAEEIRRVEDRLQKKNCGCGGELIFRMAVAPKSRNLYPYIDYNMDHRPVTVTSRKHYLSELKTRGLSEKPRGRGNKGQWV